MAGGDTRRRNVGASKDPPSSGESNRQKKKKGGQSLGRSNFKYALVIGLIFAGIVGAAVYWAQPHREYPPPPDSTLGALFQGGAVLRCEEKQFTMADGARMTGLAATRNLEPGDIMSHLPMTHVLHNGNMDQRVRTACAKPAANCHRTSQLILGLVLEARAPRPEFAAWIRHLPKTIDNVVFFKPEQLRVLDIRAKQPYSEGVSKVIEVTMDLALSLEDVEPPITEAEIRWGFAMTISRGYFVKIAGEMNEVFVPGFDLSNHAPLEDFNVLAPKCEGKECRMIVLRPIKRGEQIFANYGVLSNVELLTRYGFTLPTNLIGPQLTTLKPNAGDLPRSIWLVHPSAGFSCGTAAQLEGPMLWRKADDDATGFVQETAMRCLFLAEAFASANQTYAGLNASGPELPAACLAATTAAECVGGPNSTTGVEYIEAAGRAHYAAKDACFQIALGLQNLTQALEKIFSFEDGVSEKLGTSIGAEVRMVVGCMSYHGDRFQQLADLARVTEFGQ